MDLKLVLEENRNKRSTNKDFYQSLNFERSSMMLPISDINNVVNTYQVFENERDSSTKFSLNITLNPIMSNVLTNKLTEVTRKEDKKILFGNERLNAIQTINDNLYEYKLGYDIMDNNFMRIDTFKNGNTLNDFTGTTLYGVKKIEESINSNIDDTNGWLGIINKTKINNVKMFHNKKACEKIDLFPSRDYLLFKQNYINNKMRDNWDYVLTYPSENYYSSNLVTSEQGINGIPVTNCYIINNNGNKFLCITTAYNHGLNFGDVIKIKNNSISDNKTYLVYDIGDINRNNKNNSLLIDANKYQNISMYENTNNFRIVKVINTSDSEYYIRKFKKLPNLSDIIVKINEENIDEIIDNASTEFSYESYQPSFSRNIYNDPIFQIQYTDEIDLSFIKDNLNRPISEIYLTVIKKNVIDDYRNEPSKMFTELVSGINESAGVTGYSNIRIINGVTNDEMPIETKITKTGTTINGIHNFDYFLGDIVEYNKASIKENKLEDIQYRFNTAQRESELDRVFIYSDFFGDKANLLLYSSFNQVPIYNNMIKYWSTIDNNSSKIEISKTKKIVEGDYVNYLICTSEGETDGFYGCYNSQKIIYEKDKEYCVSFYAKSNQYGALLDWVGLCNRNKLNDTDIGYNSFYVIGNESFSLSSLWKRFTFNFIGDGKTHPLVFGMTNKNKTEFNITKIKIEEKNIINIAPSEWSLNPNEGEYKFISKSLNMDAFKEGYYYKPHYKIKLREYSEEISSEEFYKIRMCENIKYGVTYTGDTLVSLDSTDYLDTDIQYLAVKIENIEYLNNFDYVRITKNDNKKYINLKIKKRNGSNNMILIPYIKDFFGSIYNLFNNITIRKYNNNTPLYCQDSYNGMCLWREFIKNENIFTNGRFYISENYNFFLKRQDPFGQYNLRNDTFPSDLYGEQMKIEILNNIIETPNDIC